MIFPCFRNKNNNNASSLNEEIEAYNIKFKGKELPLIYTVYHLCLLANVNGSRIVKICESDRIKEYKRFKLKKKRGGFRIIQTPVSDLKYLQLSLIHI